MGMVILRRGNQLYNINILIYYDNDYLAFFLMTETVINIYQYQSIFIIFILNKNTILLLWNSVGHYPNTALKTQKKKNWSRGVA